MIHRNTEHVRVLQDPWGTDLLGSCVWDEQLPAEERRKAWGGQNSYCTLQEEMPHREFTVNIISKNDLLEKETDNYIFIVSCSAA